jgi:uncharacterized membrane protein YvlD (DUF360 family)
MLNIALGLFAIIICGVALALNTAGLITNYYKGDTYYKINMALIIALILCIVFNSVILIENILKVV